MKAFRPGRDDYDNRDGDFTNSVYLVGFEGKIKK